MKSQKKLKDRKKNPQQSAKRAFVHSLYGDWILAIILFVVVLFSYQPALNGAPIWDDDRHITRPELRSMDGLARIWTQLGATQQYYPLTHSVFWLEHRLWGDLPLGYHLINILLHVFSSLLLVKILRFLHVPGAWLAGAIFALHPVQVESVAWISELKNTLSGVFFFLTLLAYLKFDQERKRNLHFTAFGLFSLGLMSKSVIATLPVSLLVMFWWKRGKIEWKNDIAPLLPFFIVGMASGLFTSWVEHKFIISEAAKTFTFTFIERGLIAGRVFWFYLSKIIWPMDLIFIYPRWKINATLWWQYLFPMAAAVLVGICWSLRHRWRSPLAALLYFAATLFPVMGFFNVYPFRYSFVADHFLYLACVAPIAMTVACIDRASGAEHRFLKQGGGMMLLLILCLFTRKQCGMYTDIETLYQTIIRKNPHCGMAYNNLGVLLAENGRRDEAVLYYRKSLEIEPGYAESWNNLGKELLQIGLTDEARACLQKALEIDPHFAEAHNNLGVLLERIGRRDEAIAHYRKALEINPRHLNAHNNFGTLLAEMGQTKEAMSHLLKALEINPNDVAAQGNLGILLLKTDRIDEAIVHFRKALEIDPREVNCLRNFAVAYEQKGQLTEAILLLKRALAAADDSGDEAKVKEIKGNLERLNQESRSF